MTDQTPEKISHSNRIRGQFRPGQSGNPRGKPPGTRKKIVRAIESQIADAAHDLTAVVIEAALTNWRAAIELLKLLGVGKRTMVEAPDMPPMGNASDIVSAYTHIIGQVAAGEMSIEEADGVAALLEQHRKAIETEYLARRLAELKQMIIDHQQTKGA